MNINQGADIWPSYHSIRAAKKLCYPSNISITESKAEVPLQDLLDHTSIRLVEFLKDVFSHLLVSNADDSRIVYQATLTSKWGFDSCTSQSRYFQKFSGKISSTFDENSMLSTTLVPLDLSVNGKNIWRNNASSSTRFCRPIKIEYIKETSEVAKKEYAHINRQVNLLKETLFSIPIENSTEVLKISISHNLHCTAIDGKVVNAIFDVSSQACCYICGAKPTQMNDWKNKKRPINTFSLNFGLSSLHAWIRIFECILHISYRLNIKKWRITGKYNFTYCIFFP